MQLFCGDFYKLKNVRNFFENVKTRFYFKIKKT